MDRPSFYAQVDIGLPSVLKWISLLSVLKGMGLPSDLMWIGLPFALKCTGSFDKSFLHVRGVKLWIYQRRDASNLWIIRIRGVIQACGLSNKGVY